MSEPTKLKPVERPVDEDVVKTLEFLLGEAKQGNVISLAGVAVLVNHEHEQFWVGKCLLSEVMYALDCWKFRRLQQTLEESETVLHR